MQRWKVYLGRAACMFSTHEEQVNADLLAFIKARSRGRLKRNARF